jgi:hypothetical protein
MSRLFIFHRRRNMFAFVFFSFENGHRVAVPLAQIFVVGRVKPPAADRKEIKTVFDGTGRGKISTDYYWEVGVGLSNNVIFFATGRLCSGQIAFSLIARKQLRIGKRY